MLSVTILRPALVFLMVASAIAGLSVVPPPAGGAPDVQGDDRFGVAWINPPGQLASAERMRQAVDLGTRWDRFPFYWYDVQPTNATFDFSHMDRVVNYDLANGLQVQGILLGAPQWAVTGGRISPDLWHRYVFETVSHFKGRVRYWEIWNEPDLLDADGKGIFWPWSLVDYVEILKVGYKAAKAADPNVQVLLGSIAFAHNNEKYFPMLLAELAKDPSARENNWYFDILPLHLYGRAGSLFDLPMGYIGSPDFAGFHNLMRGYGFDRPIWVNEAGVGIWDTETGKNAPGRATQSEHASYIIQAFAYGLAGGIEKIFVFQLYDDGAGAVDPQTGRAEFYGLVSNAGTLRPGYTAYQTATRYFSKARLVNRVNLNRNGSADVKGIDIITMYGTPNGKVTVLWNNDGSVNQQVRLVADAPRADQINKLGQLQQVVAVSGVYTVTLAQATNNNNFDCYTPRGCSPNDFIIGGDPVILVEADSRVPPTTVKALPSGVASPFTVTWGTTSNAYSAARYDVQYMDPAEAVWRNWLVDTTTTSAQFGTGSTFSQLNHTYIFRSRGRDDAGNLLGGYDYPSNGMASTVVLSGTVVSAPPPLPTPTPQPVPVAMPDVDAKIQIVWPQDNKPVAQATKANIGAYIFKRGGLISVNQSFDRPAKLLRARNNDVEEEATVGSKTFTTKGSLRFPVWEFNDVDVSFAQDPLNKLYFRVVAEGANNLGNIWSHGADARTIFPKTDVPKGVLNTAPAAVDARIQIVWPHGGAPVGLATKANIGVYLFEHGTLNAVPVGYDRTVRLLRALNNDVEQEVAVGRAAVKTENGLTFPTWQFNDVDVSAARDGLNKYYFRVVVDGVQSYSNVWSHALDSRTHFPSRDEPTGVMP